MSSLGVSEIIPGLYIADVLSARWGTKVSELRITHIISVLEHPVSFPRLKSTDDVKFLHLPLKDAPDANLLAYLDMATDFISTALSKPALDLPLSGTGSPRVLVHCMAGISRSCAVVCAYLIATRNLTVENAIALVKSRRSSASPNSGFVKQLKEYALLSQRPNIRLLGESGLLIGTTEPQPLN